MKTLKLGPGSENPDIGPSNNKALVQQIESLIADGEKNATLLLDGRGAKVEGYPNGNWIGASIIDNVDAGMDCYDKEIFGPVMCIKRVKTFKEGLEFVNANPWGNGAACFTKNGHIAR